MAEEVDIKDYPYVVSIRSPFKEHLCSGSLVEPNWVLSSSKPIKEYSTTPKLIHVLTQPIFTNDIEGTSSSSVLRMFIRDESNLTENSFGLALLQLEHPILSVVEKYVMLPKYKLDFEFIIKCPKMEVFGFQKTNLSKATFSVSKNKECKEKNNRFDDGIKQFCGMADACLTDAGGPAICLDEPSVVYGVLLMSNNCSPTSGSISFYARVDKYLDFVSETLEDIEVSQSRKVKVEKKHDENSWITYISIAVFVLLIIAVLLIVMCTFGLGQKILERLRARRTP